MDTLFKPSSRRTLLEHLSEIPDNREPHRIAYPLAEVLMLVVCASIADCDDYDEIVDWGEHHLDYLRGFSAYYWGIPKAEWLRTLMNRMDPELFSACFEAWVRAWYGGEADLVSIDGKTSRGSRDTARERAPLHLVSAFATNQRLVLGSEAVRDKSSEHTAIPALLEKLELDGALVTIDAIGCNPGIAEDIVRAGGDYLLAVKGNQASMLADIETYFADEDVESQDTTQTFTISEKGHGRLETRRHIVSSNVDWLIEARDHSGNPAFQGLRTIAMVESTVERGGKVTVTKRYYISSAVLGAERFAEAVRGHWGIENSLHWVLDVIFREDRSRLRKGDGAKNMATVRHFALNLVRNMQDKKSIKARRKIAGWSPQYLNSIINYIRC
jgi:predicted transposase YbfD/YdcC